MLLCYASKSIRIFILKSSNHVYRVAFYSHRSLTFQKYMWQPHNQMSILASTHTNYGDHIFIKKPSLGDCQARLKSDSLFPEVVYYLGHEHNGLKQINKKKYIPHKFVLNKYFLFLQNCARKSNIFI